jgi:predicted DCC family thiol-disulfide oxidoreductase YuxK
MNMEGFDSIVFIRDVARQDTAFSLRTAGVLLALAEMGGGWRRLARVLGVIPQPLRDGMYRVIARVRYKLFGEYRPTPLPNPDWAQRILE